MKIFPYAAAILILSANSFAQNSEPEFPSVNFFGSVRYRTEIDGRFFDFNAKPLKLDLLKTQLGASVHLNNNVSVAIRLQDSRNFGEESGSQARGTLDGSAENIGLREGYGLWNNILVDGLNVKFGRMLFSTNNERLLGSLEWHNVGRSFDGVEAQYLFSEKISARIFAFKLGSDELTMTQSVSQTPQSLFGIEANLPWQDKLNVYGYLDRNSALLQRGVDAGKPHLNRGTIGFYIKNAIHRFEYEIEAAHQLGSQKTTDSTAQAAINANLFTAFLSYKVADNLSSGIGVDYYTGNDNATTGTNELFDHLFTTIHKFYGYMDFLPFTVLPSSGQRKALSPAVASAGLTMLHSRTTYTINKDWSLQLWAMLMNSQQPIPNVESQYLGTEIDLNAFYAMSKNVKVEAGASVFLPGDAIQKTNPSQGMGNDIAYWGYLMITLGF